MPAVAQRAQQGAVQLNSALTACLLHPRPHLLDALCVRVHAGQRKQRPEDLGPLSEGGPVEALLKQERGFPVVGKRTCLQHYAVAHHSRHQPRRIQHLQKLLAARNHGSAAVEPRVQRIERAGRGRRVLLHVLQTRFGLRIHPALAQGMDVRVVQSFVRRAALVSEPLYNCRRALRPVGIPANLDQRRAQLGVGPQPQGARLREQLHRRLEELVLRVDVHQAAHRGDVHATLRVRAVALHAPEHQLRLLHLARLAVRIHHGRVHQLVALQAAFLHAL
mmetsp:Transcript_6435/g.23879  ORF Transcript_6435/g.23879 Transcript_6435/m.23879 type:complete len:277 (-) Transcript_6435:600-1430(-)